MDLTKKLCSMAKLMGANFTFNGKPMAYEQVFAYSGLLPGLAKRADQLASLCLGYGIGVSFEDVTGDTAPLGTQVKFDEVTPDILRLLCIGDVVSELIKNSPSKDKVSLDELLYD